MSEEFKVGDRVVCTERYPPVEKGDIGIVVHITDSNPPIGVSWSQTRGNVGFHSCDEHCEEEDGYYLPVKNLKKISSAEKPAKPPKKERAFKVGDKVEIITGCEYEKQGMKDGKKMVGKVVEDDGGDYLPFHVKWENVETLYWYGESHIQKISGRVEGRISFACLDETVKIRTDRETKISL